MVEQRGKATRGGPTLPGPAIVEAPAGASREVEGMYEKVREAFPGWRGVVGNRGASVMGGGQGQMLAQQGQGGVEQQQQQQGGPFGKMGPGGAVMLGMGQQQISYQQQQQQHQSQPTTGTG